MGDKYIIELEDRPFYKEDGDFLYRAKGFNSLVFDMTGIGKLTPYTEPDLSLLAKENFERGYRQRKAEDEKEIEQVRKEAYQQGYEQGYKDGYHEPGKNQQEAYQRGLNDAWEAARKLEFGTNNGGIPTSIMEEIFGTPIPNRVLRDFTADEVIEEIRAHEQAQKEREEEKSISVEDVMRQYLVEFCCNAEGCAKCPLNTSDFTCGRGYHFIDAPVSDEEVRRAYAKVVKEK